MKKIIKLLLIAMGVIMTAPTFTSCKDDEEEDLLNPIVGTWYCECYFDSNPEDYSSFTFYADKTLLLQTYYFNENRWNVDEYKYIGVYNISENIITINMNSDEFSDNIKGVYQAANSIISIDGEIFYRQ